MTNHFNASNFAATFSGKRIDLNDVKPDDIEIVDIAVGLSNQCRYAGQVWPFYSVAEHSILVSHLVPLGGPYSRNPLLALMHDAPEFIAHDIIRPVKRMLDGYEELESRVMTAIDEKFQLKYSDEKWAIIKKWDDLITVSERRELMPRLDPEAYGRGVPEASIPKIKFKCMSPPQAALAFLNRFFQLSFKHPSREQTKLIDIIRSNVQ